MVQKAYEAGRDLEKKYGGCARCTVALFRRPSTLFPA